jgi:hypothetical protein
VEWKNRLRRVSSAVPLGIQIPFGGTLSCRSDSEEILRVRRLACLLFVFGCSSAVVQSAPDLTPDQVTSLLASLHADYGTYICDVHYGASRLHPATLYAGLVRRGGLDPRDPRDVPRTGRGVANDLVIYADTFEPWRTPAWRLLIADHEYFHARHYAKGFAIPAVGFGQAKADSDYQEALAWGYVLGRAALGVYGALSEPERVEVANRYRDHFSGFHTFVMKQQASAWAHYGRFLPEPGSLFTPAASAPTEATSPPAGQGTR